MIERCIGMIWVIQVRAKKKGVKEEIMEHVEAMITKTRAIAGTCM